MIKNKQKLITQMTNDLRIQQYQGEEPKHYYARLIYSALADWIRFCLYDETLNDDEMIGEKSKRYVLKRGIEMLELFLSFFPECEAYFKNGEELAPKEVIQQIRNNMVRSGELIENKNHYIQILDQKYRQYLGYGIYREFGISKIRDRYHVGLAQIKQSIRKDEIKIDITDPGKLINWIIRNGKREKLEEFDRFEFFNPYIKDIPSKCWGRFQRNTNFENYWLVRLKAKDGIRYGIIQNKYEDYIISWMDDRLITWHEERRIILGFRFLVNNKVRIGAKKIGEGILLSLGAWLPEKETILLQTYCWPYDNVFSKNKYIVPQNMWNYFKNLFIQLRIEIIEG